MSPIALRSLLLVGGLPVSTQDAVTSAPKAASDAVQAAFGAWIWLLASVVLVLISWVNGLQPNLAAALFAIAAAPAFATFVVLPSINADWAAALVLSVWLASVTILVAATGGAASLLTGGFAVVLAQAVALKRAWVGEAGAAAALAYALGAAIAANRGALPSDLGAWPQMMVVAYLTFSAGVTASALAGLSRARLEQRLAEVAHELRTPLTHILGFSEMIERQVFGPLHDKYVEYAGLIRASGAHLLEISNDILDLSRIDAGRYRLTMARLDARDVVREVLAASSLSAEARGIVLSSSLPETPLLIYADRRALARILVNTVGNAIKFTPLNGRVRVSVRVEKDALVLETADNGPGLSEAEKKRLGQAYERGASGLGVEGAGLGLSLVRALAALHGGRLSFEDAEGGGALVRVTLPVVISE